MYNTEGNPRMTAISSNFHPGNGIYSSLFFYSKKTKPTQHLRTGKPPALGQGTCWCSEHTEWGAFREGLALDSLLSVDKYLPKQINVIIPTSIVQGHLAQNEWWPSEKIICSHTKCALYPKESNVLFRKMYIWDSQYQSKPNFLRYRKTK